MSQDFTKLRRAVEMEGALFGMVMAEGSQLVGHAAPFPKSKAVSIIETLRTMQSGHGNEEDLQVVSIGFGEQNLLAVFRNDLLVVALHPSVDDTDAFIHVLVSSLNPDTARSDDEPEFDPMMNTSSMKKLIKIK